MGTWTIEGGQRGLEMLESFGHIYKDVLGYVYFEFSGDTLQEAADSLMRPLAEAFTDYDVKVIEYPEHVIVDENVVEYANGPVKKEGKLIIPCKCEKSWRGEKVVFDKDVIIYLKKENMPVKEMRDLLDQSRAEFSREYGIPVRTLENWESGKSKCPEYVRQLLKRAVMEDYQKK